MMRKTKTLNLAVVKMIKEQEQRFNMNRTNHKEFQTFVQSFILSVTPLTSPFSSWTISTLRSVSLGSSSLKFSIFFQRTGIFPSHVYIWDFYEVQQNTEIRTQPQSHVIMNKTNSTSQIVLKNKDFNVVHLNIFKEEGEQC